MSPKTSPIPLKQRPTDIFIVVCLSFFCWVAMNRGPLSIWDALNADNHSSSAILVRSIIPSVMQDGLKDWGDTIEPQFKMNPTWARCMNLWNFFFLVPFYFVTIYGISQGKNWVKTPFIVGITTVMYSTIIIMLHNHLYQPFPLQPFPYYASYVPFVVLPLVFIYRISFFGFDSDPFFPKKAKTQ